MLYLDHEAVRKAYSMEKAIPLMAEAMRRYSAGQVTQPLRTIVRPASQDSLLAVMPCHAAGDDAGYGLKAIMLKPDNPGKGLDAHIGVVLVFDPDTGKLAALLDGGAVTAVRTAAVSAVATRALANPGAGDLAILGSGIQARGHLEAMSNVRELRRVRVWSRTPEHAERFCRWAAGTGIRVPAENMPTVAAALEGADLVCTTLACADPVVAADDLAPGAHVNAVGASVPAARELTSAAVARCALFVDSRESAVNESGDFRSPLAEGLISADHIQAELGDVLLGRHPGRRQDGQITLYKSLGLAVQDIFSGFAILRSAEELGLGIRLDVA